MHLLEAILFFFRCGSSLVDGWTAVKMRIPGEGEQGAGVIAKTIPAGRRTVFVLAGMVFAMAPE